jgi:predicted transcriptional regulator
MPTPNGRFIRCTRIEAGLKPGDLAREADIPPHTLYCI